MMLFGPGVNAADTTKSTKETEKSNLNQQVALPDTMCGQPQRKRFGVIGKAPVNNTRQPMIKHQHCPTLLLPRCLPTH